MRRHFAFFKGETFMATLNKHVRRLIVALIIILVIAAILVGVAFGVVNNLKFMTYTKSKLSRLASGYDSSAVRFIAHRGLSVDEYQNTREAFELAAADATVWGIETDIWATSDGEFVCMHDKDSLDGISNVRDVTFEKATTTPLKDNKNRYAASFDEYLNICKRSGKTAIIEIKDKDMSNTDLDLVMQKVADSGASFRYISFHFDKLKYIRSKLSESEAKLQLLVYNSIFNVKKQKEAISLRIDLSCMYQFLNKKAVQRFHDAGLEVGVWTVNSARDAMCCVADLGVDYVTTDYSMSKMIDSFIAGLK